MPKVKATDDVRIYCCHCAVDVSAVLTNGGKCYPHRADLASLPFWACPTCENFVGTHHKSTDPLRPLGVIATPKIKEARRYIHRILDPLWKKGKMKRNSVYAEMAKRMGVEVFHTGEIRSIDEARLAYCIARQISDEVRNV